MKRTFLILLITLATMPCSGEDFAKLFSGIEIAWAVTPADLNNNWESNINVFWFGKGSDYKIYRDKEDQTNVLWHFTHYAFANPGPAAISEPFIVVDESSGTFILHFIMPSMSPDEAVQFIKNHKEPYHILIAGKPKYLKEFKGAASVVIESDRWVVRDYFEVRFIKVKP